MKQYTLIVGGSFSLVNETDAIPQTDYFPGIWSISSQKRALELAKKTIAEGNEVTVSCYDNPTYFALSNKFIKDLGLTQTPFKEIEPLKSEVVTNGKPANLSQLKKYLLPSVKITIKRFRDGEVSDERVTSVLATQTNNVIVEKTLGSGIKSWLTLGKAADWTFDNAGATNYYLERDGNYTKSVRIEYI